MTPTLSRTVLYCFAVFCLSFGLAALPWLPPPAQAADITILGGSGGGGGGGNGATQGTAGTNGANSIGGQGGGGGYGASGTGNAGGGGGASFINGTYHTDRNGGDASGSTPGTAGTVVGSGSVGFAGEANSSHQGGRGGVGAQAILNTSDTAADNIYVYGGNGGQGGQGGTTAGYYGGDGGGGGRAALTLNNNINVFGNVYVQSGRGGNGARNPNGSGTSGAGGTGDDASLSLSGALTANRVYVITSGDGQTNTTFPLNPGAGGNVGFFAGSLAAQYIDLLKNTGGNLAFNVGTLDVTSGDTTIDIFRTTAGTTSTVMGDDGVYIGTARLGNGQLQITSVLNNPGSALIDTLQLVGRGGFSDTTNPVTTGNLTVDGGTLHNGNWSGLIDRTYTTSDITLGSSGATVELGTGEDKTLARVLTGSGDLTKTGAGMLTLSVANTYSGTTTVSGGTLRLEDAGAAGSATSAISTGTVGNEGTLALAFNGGFTRNVSGAGGLTADPGFGNTLTLSGASNAYTGMTTVQSGTLQLGSPLASTHLTLHGGATFNQNSQTHTLDNGSLTVRGENATYDGDLSATSATLNFIAPASVSQPLLTVTGTADITGSAVNLGVSGGTSLPKGTQLTLVKTTILTNLTANNLTQGSGIVEAGVTAIYGLAL
ncbi:MAG: autotransporter-associated beta strand repeat-containing protein, partial [Desulfarculales bacterium]|nr:autotransporter-associated beta strand repeat-containing protein [Desulfarculales bacterium]